MKRWTIKEIKDELPEIPVRLGDGTMVKGKLAGRYLEFACVFIRLHESDFRVDVCWETAQHILNNNVYLKV